MIDLLELGLVVFALLWFLSFNTVLHLFKTYRPELHLSGTDYIPLFFSSGLLLLAIFAAHYVGHRPFEEILHYSPEDKKKMRRKKK